MQDRNAKVPKISIAQITNGSIRLPSSAIGGNESNIYNLCKQLKEFGISTLAVDNCYKDHGDVPGIQYDGAVEILRVRPAIPSLHLFGSDLLYRLSRLLNRTVYMISAAISIRKTNIQLVHCYDITSLFVMSLFTLGSKKVYTHTSSNWPRNSDSLLNTMLDRIFARLLVNPADRVIVPNAFIMNSLARAGINRQKIRLIPPGIAVAEGSKIFTESKNNGHGFALFVGRVNREKGVDSLLQATDYIVNHQGRKDFRLIIAGPLEEFDRDHKPTSFSTQLRQFIIQKNLVPNVKMTGMVTQHDLSTLYGNCACLALPSRVEAYGQVISEAFVFSKPVVATSTPGALMQITNGAEGFLVDIDDHINLGNCMLRLIDDPDLANKLGRNGNKLAQERLWPVVSRKYLRVYEEIYQ